MEAEHQDAFTIGSNLGVPNYDDIQAGASFDISTTDSESESSGEGESKSAVFHQGGGGDPSAVGGEFSFH